MGKISSLIERISALQRSAMRKYALEHNLQMVHLEVLTYLESCNRYSDTTQALSEYLGQTKGSISQTVNFLENDGFIKRVQDLKDKRVFHLHLLPKAQKLVEGFDEQFWGKFSSENITEKSLEETLNNVQKQNGLKSFGICSTCRYNNNPTGKKFVCGLTLESLSAEDIKLRCREHEAS